MPSPRRAETGLALAAGAVAALVGVGIAQLGAAVLAPEAGPLVAVGGFAIDAVPGTVKKTVIETLGTADKPALLVVLGVLALALGALAGLAEARRPPAGRIALTVLSVAVLAVVAVRIGAGPFALAPTALGAIAAVIALTVLGGRLRELRWGGADTDPLETLARRRFLRFGIGALAVGLGSAVAGTAVGAAATASDAARRALRLPRPSVPAPAVTAANRLEVEGITPIVTAASDFYRIDTALAVPRIDPDAWRLRVDGMVARPFELSLDELLALPLVESYVTLACVSNEVGGDLIGNARWLGYPLWRILERARPRSGADMVLSTSDDGFTAGTPLEAATDPTRGAILAVGMNGRPLPAEHGFPVRMVVPGLYGYVSATKWLTRLELTRFDRVEAYWTRQGWSPRGPIKLESRIDVLRSTGDGGFLAAGVAWHQHVGVSGVQVQLDDGDWRDAELSTPISADTWVQWRLRGTASQGRHRVTVRAIGADGEVQTAKEADPVPDGASGRQQLTLTI